MENSNFAWLKEDIFNTLTIKVIKKSENGKKIYQDYEFDSILNVFCEPLSINTANIDDLISLLTIDIVRFVNFNNPKEVIDIPFRNMFRLFENGYNLNTMKQGIEMTIDELEAFTSDDAIKVTSYIINKPTSELTKIINLVKKYKNLSYSERFNALCELDTINNNRLKEEKG